MTRRSNRLRRRLLGVLLAVALGAGVTCPPRTTRADEPAWTLLEAPQTVEGMRLEDVDGDGAQEIFLLERRDLWGYAGRKGALPSSRPTWRVRIPDDVSFVDLIPGRPAGSGLPGPRLLLLGTAGVRSVQLGAGDGEAGTPAGGVPLTWRDWRQATFTDLVLPDGGALLPVPEGWRYVPDVRAGPGGQGPPGRTRAAVDLPVPWFREVEAPGRFLGDVGVATVAMPRPWVGPPPAGTTADSPPVVWTFAGTDLLAAWGGQRRRQSYAFLPANGVERLVDLDGDGAPEVVHQEGSNRESTIAAFRSPPLALGPDGKGMAAVAEDPRPAIAVVRLTGYLLDPEFTDLDGDGTVDLVATTIPIDVRNTLRALGGAVTAGTRAFLTRKGALRGAWPATPDAEVQSDVGVQIRFSAAGNIEIVRSFTIVVDGDYDGDGRKDLAIRDGPDGITIRRGVGGGGVWEKEGRRVAIPPMGESPSVEARAADVDGDGRDELILVYAQPPGGRDRVVILRP